MTPPSFSLKVHKVVEYCYRSLAVGSKDKNLRKNLLAMQPYALASVVRRLDNAIRWIKLYLVDHAIRFAITYPPDSDLSVG